MRSAKNQLRHLYQIKPLYSINQVDYFLQSQVTDQFTSQRDAIDVFKDIAKQKLGTLYVYCVYIFAPVMPRIQWGSKKLFLNYLIDQWWHQGSGFSLQVGSGVSQPRTKLINLDIFPYQGVRVVADATALPFSDASFHNYLSVAVLEHVADPEAMIGEAARVLKKGGTIITGAPFIQGFHASPHDYTRWTDAGLRALHERHGFTTITVEPIGGPASAFAWICIDFFSILFSFGSRTLFYCWFSILSVLCFPIKLLDLFLIKQTESRRITSFFVYVGRKK